MSNPYFDPNPPSKAHEAMTQELEQLKQKAKAFNESKNSEKPIIGKLKRYCSLCNSELVKSKKTEKLDGLDLELLKFKCPTCHQYYIGIGKDLYTPNHKGKAIVFELSEVI
jgi:hypothetical protein